ncbi:MAG: thioredoxin-disulfide reductase [Desulfovibrio sp.]|jgi:thioredoxin reductase (NADPH)|nr:thioredoxin-disulfide reductase [Desulfovibrio sp.]
MEKRELVIIGAGPAGLSAAIYGRRAGLDTLVLEKGRPGGQILSTNRVENYPGILDGTGTGLADAFRAHAELFKAEIRSVSVQRLEVRGGEKIVTLKDGREIAAGAVILATGAAFRKQGCPGEKKYTGMGVSYCAVCDAAFFEDLDVAVIGGGNTAVEEACYLTGFASKVYLIHRRDEFRADRLVVDCALANPKIEPVMDSVLESIEGGDMVERIVVRNVKTNERRTIELSGVFIFIGLLPNTGFLGDLLRTDGGWIVTDDRLATSVPGIFAAGDVRTTPLRQVVTAAGDGARAAMSAYGYLHAARCGG